MFRWSWLVWWLVVLASCSDESVRSPRSAGADAGEDGNGGQLDGGTWPCTTGPATVVRYDTAYRKPEALLLGHLGTVYDPASPSQIAAQVGPGFGLDAVDSKGEPFRKVFAAFSEHDDVPGATQTQGVLQSSDGGNKFFGYHSGVAIPPLFAIKLRSGRVLSLDFVAEKRVDKGGQSILTFGADQSMDDGQSWSQTKVELFFPPLVSGYGRPSGHMTELADGTILLPYYMKTVGAVDREALLLASKDGGATFKFRARIASPPKGKWYSEPDVVQLRDGSLYSIFRHQEGVNTLLELLESRSDDEGHTWSTPKPVQISVDGASTAKRIGINPQLQLLPNGIAVLSSGRPDNFVAIAPKASFHGVVWEQGRVTYVNYPRASTKFNAKTRRYHGSSGNTGLVEVGPNRLIQIGDNCAASWGCPPEDSQHDVDNKYRVWRRFVEVVSEDVGKIDLAGWLGEGKLAVTGNMGWTSKAHPRVGVRGAFDGSTEPWSSAVAAGKAGELVFAFSEPIELTRVGLSLGSGRPVSGGVEVSADGKCWHSIVPTQTRTHHALEYFQLSAPLRVSHLRVRVGSQTCAQGPGSDCAILNEIEIYSTVNSFENDAINNVPRGYSAGGGVWVTAAQSGVTGRALRIVDDKDDKMAIATWVGTAAADKHLSFRLLPVLHDSAFLFGIGGLDANKQLVNSFHFGAFSDGTLRHYSSATGQWTAVTASGLISASSVHTIRVEAALDSAKLFLDGKLVATIQPTKKGVKALDRHYFSSAGTKAVGGHFVVDDVYFH